MYYSSIQPLLHDLLKKSLNRELVLITKREILLRILIVYNYILVIRFQTHQNYAIVKFIHLIQHRILSDFKLSLEDV